MRVGLSLWHGLAAEAAALIRSSNKKSSSRVKDFNASGCDEPGRRNPYAPRRGARGFRSQSQEKVGAYYTPYPVGNCTLQSQVEPRKPACRAKSQEPPPYTPIFQGCKGVSDLPKTWYARTLDRLCFVHVPY